MVLYICYSAGDATFVIMITTSPPGIQLSAFEGKWREQLAMACPVCKARFQDSLEGHVLLSKEREGALSMSGYGNIS